MGICKNALTENKRCINSESCQNNQPITQLIVKDKKGKVIERFEANDSKEKPMVMPPTFLSEKKKSCKVSESNLNLMPPIVLAGVGDTSPSMIRGGEEELKMRKCQTEGEQGETPMVMPACVGKEKNK